MSLLPRPQAVAALLAALALGGGVGACGGSQLTGDAVPKSTPELLPPSNTSLAPAAASESASSGQTGTAGTAGTGSTDTNSSSSSSGGSAPSATPTPAPTPAAPAAPTPAPATPTPTPTPTPTKKTAPPAATGGADAGGFSDFCKNNPGACPGQ